ncbi:MAG: FtsH protease activity modulator HflK [Dehalococcoidia bacterium]
MSQPPQGQPPEIDLEQLLRGAGSGLNRILGRLGGGGVGAVVILILVVVAILWLATGVYTVAPAEQAALRTFGRFTGTAGPGLHWFWPAPIGTRNIEAVTETRRMELGFRTLQGDQAVDVPFEALMITGDLNIVDVQMVVQYRIKDLEAFLFRIDDPGEPDRGIDPGRPEGRSLRDATEAALRQVVGQRAIDDVLTIGKEQVQADTQLLLQQILDDYNTGIQILNVRLLNVRPPDVVRDAFDDVVRARVDKESRINEANAYREDIIPRAEGQAAQVVQGAEAFKAERIARATGEASRFLAVLREYQQSQEVTRQRLYLETMEEVLPGITIFIVDPDAGGNLLQFLPLEPGAPLPQPPPAAEPERGTTE